MPIYSKAPRDIADFVTETLEAYHPRLNEAGVTIGVLIAEPTERDMNNGEPPFLKLHGYGCNAVVSITPAKQRVQGIPDAVVTIDAEIWKTLSGSEREALIDHEGAHLLLVRDKDGDFKTDDHGRPKLKMRLHDVQCGWFMDVAERHGIASFEVKQARIIQEAYGQLLFSFAEGPPPVLKVMESATA